MKKKYLDLADTWWIQKYPLRRGSRRNTDRFPKRVPKVQASSGVREKAPPGKKLTECWPDGNLESVFIIKNIQEKLSSLETY